MLSYNADVLDNYAFTDTGINFQDNVDNNMENICKPTLMESNISII